ERTILLDGFSKTYAMTGWRVAYACAAPAIIEAMLNIHQYTVACAPRIAQQAAIAALRCDNGYVSAVVAEYDQRRKLFLTGLRAAGLPCHEPSGAFYVFPSIEGSGLSSEVFAARLLEEERVLLVPGSTFGDSGRGFVRCAYTVETPTLVDALGRIKRF